MVVAHDHGAARDPVVGIVVAFADEFRPAGAHVDLPEARDALGVRRHHQHVGGIPAQRIGHAERFGAPGPAGRQGDGLAAVAIERGQHFAGTAGLGLLAIRRSAGRPGV